MEKSKEWKTARCLICTRIVKDVIELLDVAPTDLRVGAMRSVKASPTSRGQLLT